MRYRTLFLSMLLASATCGADDVPAGEPMASAAPVKPAKSEPAQATPVPGKTEGGDSKTEGGDKALSGMSILGNQEAPKSLVIVPWKSSVMGDTLGLSEQLDDSRRPVDKQVFMRELGYYEIRSASK
jgi:hypothetical protein